MPLSLIHIYHKEDEWNHFLALCHGILTGETLAKIAIEDAIGAVSVLNGLNIVDKTKIGCLGPVSYTHLDVYKRQGRGSAEGFRTGTVQSGNKLEYEELYRRPGGTHPPPGRS